jgi:hypothetical protein
MKTVLLHSVVKYQPAQDYLCPHFREARYREIEWSESRITEGCCGFNSLSKHLDPIAEAVSGKVTASLFWLQGNQPRDIHCTDLH